ncbi:MAG: Nif3-like dinuclear metal center hexameric protein [Chloroflexi bacterium]|nr:Nif3-like dinuclear metal center hexameric protein [Chloroflexota bacterium]
MVRLSDLIGFLQELMGDAGEKDPYLANGLQFPGQEQIQKLATGVSASIALFEKAVAAGAQALLVHHSINRPQGILLDNFFLNRVRFLMENNLSLIGYHYLLDHHPQVGHAAQIIQKLGGEITTPYYDGWGWYGELANPRSREQVFAECEQLFGVKGVQYPLGPEEIKKMVVITGKGAPYTNEMQVLIDHEVDVFITGEVHEWVREAFHEAKINFLAAGHYNTECFGIWALGDVIREKFDVEVEFLDLPNEV